MTEELSVRPKAQRSRACRQCRERRVKCDETPKLCHQCRRLGLTCSGPVQGSLIIDMTHKITKPRPRKKRETTVSPTDSQPSPTEDVSQNTIIQETPQVSVRPAGRRESAPSARPTQMFQDVPPAPRPYQFKLRTVYEPSLVDVYDRAFISHFVHLHFRAKMNMQEVCWLSKLQDLHSKSTHPALSFSIRAASMAFYARVHHDTSVLTDSFRWYITSLNRQRMSLSKLDSRTVPGHVHILVPIIFGVYEVYAGTTPMSVFQHLTAASKVLEMIGPRNCASGLANQLFRAMRVSDAHKCLIFNQPSVFSSPEWLTLPFTVQPKNVHQELGDIILAIPRCTALCNIQGPLSEFFSRDIPEHTDLAAARQCTSQLIVKLHDWAKKYPEFCHLDPPTESDGGPDTPPNQVPLTYIALSASTYHAVRLTLTLLCHKISADGIRAAINNEPLTLSVLDEASNDAASILQISAYLEDYYPLGFDFIRSVFPLVVVLSIAPREKERKAANEVLARWGAKRGVGGICGPWIMR